MGLSLSLSLQLPLTQQQVASPLKYSLKYPFLDIDTLIEQLASCSISDIFKDEGAERFEGPESLPSDGIF